MPLSPLAKDLLQNKYRRSWTLFTIISIFTVRSRQVALGLSMLCHYWGEKVGEVLIFCVVVFLFLFKLLKLGIYVIFITRREDLPSNFSSHDATRELSHDYREIKKKKQCNSYIHVFRKLNKLFKSIQISYINSNFI